MVAVFYLALAAILYAFANIQGMDTIEVGGKRIAIPLVLLGKEKSGTVNDFRRPPNSYAGSAPLPWGTERLTTKPTSGPSGTAATNSPATSPLSVPVPTSDVAGTISAGNPQPAKGDRQGLGEVDCGPNCSGDFVPATSNVKWLQPPAVSSSGVLSLEVRISEGDHLTLPGGFGGGASNIALTNGSSTLYGFVIPPAGPGFSWNPAPGQWTADVYQYRDKVLILQRQLV